MGHFFFLLLGPVSPSPPVNNTFRIAAIEAHLGILPAIRRFASVTTQLVIKLFLSVHHFAKRENARVGIFIYNNSKALSCNIKII